jgi:hypothetical protein
MDAGDPPGGLDLNEVETEVSVTQRWMQAIRQVVLPRYVGRVVIFVDEIDAVRSLPFSTDEFFAGIREFYNARPEDEKLERLTFCLLGVATPSDLIRDTRTTPFNIGQRIELHDFTVVLPLAALSPRSIHVAACGRGLFRGVFPGRQEIGYVGWRRPQRKTMGCGYRPGTDDLQRARERYLVSGLLSGRQEVSHGER